MPVQVLLVQLDSFSQIGHGQSAGRGQSIDFQCFFDLFCASRRCQPFFFCDLCDLVHTDADRFTVELPRGADYAKKLYQLSSAISQLETNETGTFNMNDEEKTFFIPAK